MVTLDRDPCRDGGLIGSSEGEAKKISTAIRTPHDVMRTDRMITSCRQESLIGNWQ
jgi:hypothetical protein